MSGGLVGGRVDDKGFFGPAIDPGDGAVDKAGMGALQARRVPEFDPRLPCIGRVDEGQRRTDQINGLGGRSRVRGEAECLWVSERRPRTEAISLVGNGDVSAYPGQVLVVLLGRGSGCDRGQGSSRGRCLEVSRGR